MKIQRCILSVGVGGVCLIASIPAHAVAVTVSTIGVYAANPNALTINDVTSNSAAGGITLSSFRSLIVTAFAGDLGGVMDGETTTGWATGVTVGDGSANAVSATFGTSQSKTLSLYRSDPTLGIDGNNNNGTSVVSGTSYIGEQGAGSPFNLVFAGQQIVDLGFTMVPRGAARTVIMTATLDDNSTIVSSAGTINGDNTPGPIFYGFAAPTGRFITGLNVNEAAGGFARFDDLGFVTASPAPEPCSVLALGLGAVCLLKRRRSRS